MSEDIFNTLENDINNGSNNLDGAIDLEDLQNNNIEELQATASFLKIKELCISKLVVIKIFNIIN